MGEFIAFVICLAVVLGSTALAFALQDHDEWVKTEDPACYLHVHEDKHLIAPDITTRTRYCEVES